MVSQSLHPCSVLHEFGALLAKHDITWTPEVLPASKMAEIVELVLSKRITSGAAKQLLAEALFDKSSSIHDIASARNLLITELTDAEYNEVVSKVLDDNPDFMSSVTANNIDKKLKGLVGMAMGHFKRTGNQGSVEPRRLQRIAREQLDSSLNM
jgi:Asp-tRNA(Asn)/Glu-tRNA(Gln) amidotransferase B subunit